MIRKIQVREILDSQRQPTLEVGLETDDGLFQASVPSGASKGKYEAKALGVGKAIKNINEIIGPKLKNRDVIEQKEIDQLMNDLDGTGDKSKLGANAILAVSMAVARAGAVAKNLPLYQYIFYSTFSTAVEKVLQMPRPCFNIINGGAHAHPVRGLVSNGASNDLAIQEFMVIPQMESFEENLRVGEKVYHYLKEILEKTFGKSGIKLGDEAGFVPPISRTKEALDLLMKAISSADIGLDCAASQFFKDGKYNLDGKEQGREELLNFYQDLTKNYPILFIEDPFAQDDWEGWKKISSKLLVVGDDLTVTNPKRIKMAQEKKACNGLIIKPNQIGTITETLEAIKLAQSFNWKIVVSHRSGETNDDFIADLAVGVGADFIKAGAPATPERMAKYNRLLQIEKELS